MIKPCEHSETPESGDNRSTARGIIPRVRQAVARLLPRGSLARRFAHGASWNLAGAVAAQGLNLAASVVRANVLGKEGFGEFGLILSTVATFGIFAGMGMGLTATKFVAELRTRDPERAGRIIGLTSSLAFVSSAIIALSVFLLTPWIAAYVLNVPHLGLELRVACALLFFNALIGAQNGSLSGFEAFKPMARINMIAGVLNFVMGVAGVWWWGLRGTIVGMVLAAGVNWLINYRTLRGEVARAGIPVRWLRWRGEVATVLKFSLPSLGSALLYIPAGWVLNAMLSHQPGGKGELGLFSATQQWFQLILFLPGVVSQAAMPMLASLWGERKLKEFERLLVSNVLLFAGIGVGLAIPIALASPWIMKIYGAGFSQGAHVLVWVCVYSVLWVAVIPVGQAIWSMGEVKTGMILSVLRFVSLVVAFKFLLHLGAYGMALAYVITYVIQVLALVPYIWWRIRRRTAA